jgi:nucleotide-binding universal stress UspA family protein
MEPKIKSILLAAGLGAHTGYVLDHALSLARKYQAKIHIIYGLDIMKLSAQSTAELYLSQGELEDSIEKSLEEEESHIRGQLQSICHERLEKLRADESLIAGIDIERKPATQAILDAAALYRADLIVMGAQRLPGLSGARLGPTTMKVLNRAMVPVFVVKGGAGQAR